LFDNKSTKTIVNLQPSVSSWLPTSIRSYIRVCLVLFNILLCQYP
jgi:hypothetical protein